MANQLVVEQTELVPAESAPEKWRRLRLLRRSPLALTAACFLIVIALLALIGPLFFEDQAQLLQLQNRFLTPFHLSHGFDYILGGDTLGRPMLLQLVLGARTSLIIAVAAVGISAIVGSAIGIVSGYFGRWLDATIMRITDILHTLPSLLFALAVLYVLQPSVLNIILVLAVARLPVYMRVARAQVLEVRERVFVEAAHAIGSRTRRILLRDIRPMVTPTIMTVAMLEIANVILAAAGLSFLGVGLQRPEVDWGLMVSTGRSYLGNAWWVTVFPGIAVVLTALAANILSNWLRAIEDPAQSGMFVVPLEDNQPDDEPNGGERS